MSVAPFLAPALLEYLEYDARWFQWLVAMGGTSAAALLASLPDKKLTFRIASRLHRSAGSPAADGIVERTLARVNQRERRGQPTGLWSHYEAHVQESLRSPDAAAFRDNPAGLLGYRVLVLKSPGERERGVITVDYSYIFSLFAGLFDVEAIARDYYIVLEPSWRGLCTADILSYSRYDFPVFVETIEPRDIAFVNALRSNLTTVPVAANWWVDHRLVKPDPTVRRDIDVIMVAAWSAVKRHWRFFRVLADLKRRGHRLNVALVGYPMDRRRQDIEHEAQICGVRDQLQLHERLPLEEVGRLLARSRAHLLWSRKEGANRAIIEALFADVPIIVREGLGYGHAYPYVNSSTGVFANERTLGDRLLEIVHSSNTFHPRAWALANMSCQRATEILEARIREVALAGGERWTRGLAVKTVKLETQRYWDPEDAVRFESDYARLRSHIRALTVIP